MVNKVDSNITGLRYVEEDSLATLPGSPVWKPLEPNSYGDFGAQITQVAREPINNNRQLKKGVTVDLSAGAGFNSDLTETNLQDLIQGFLFAATRAKLKVDTVASVTAGTSKFAKTSAFSTVVVGDLLFMAGFANSGNNGLHRVTAASANDVTVTGTLVDETPAATATIKKVGHQGGSADITIDATDPTAPVLGSTSFDFTTLGLVAGEWIYIGSDTSGERFATAANNGFARVKTIAAHAIVVDKTSATWVTDAGTGKTIRIFVGDCVKNETGDSGLIVKKTYQFERDLGDAGLEYVVGCYPNVLGLNFAQAAKITWDMSFVATDYETVADGDEKSGTRPALTSSAAFNTTSDFSRLRMAPVGVFPTALFAYVSDMKLAFNNNVSPDKAIAYLGAFDATAGNFAVTGNATAYFNDRTVLNAVRAGSDVTLDMALVKDNVGMIFDIPRLTLGDGRLQVVKDKAIQVPLTLQAAEDDTYHHTLLVNFYDYLPTAAG